MFRVDKALFSNVVTAVQRTSNLPGGAVRNLPGGASLEGMKGVDSFAAEVADAKKEFELGRVHVSVARVRQIEMQFNSIVGRWNAQAGSILASARQGKQAVPLQKLNEVRNAQSKMRQLTAPATKSFRDLITALEHAVASQGDVSKAENLPEEDEDAPNEDSGSTEHYVSEERVEPESVSGAGVIADGSSERPSNESPQEDVPDLNLIGRFADKYRFGPKLGMKVAANKKRYLSPKLEEGRFYFVQGLPSPTVVRVREIHSRSVLVFDALKGVELPLDTTQLKMLISKGIWLLEPFGKPSD